MGKRKLTRRQSWRIDKIQQERVDRANRRDVELQESLEAGDLGGEQFGLVVAHFGTQVAVEGQGREAVRCHMRANLGGLVTGDRVIWRESDLAGVVVAKEPRQNELARPDPYGAMKAIAANIDQLLVVIAPLPESYPEQVDRYLVAAEAAGIQPAILLNKADLLTAPENAERGLRLKELLDDYRRLGYSTLQVSATGQQGLASLQQALQSNTSVFVGQSGVGKSSLINVLLPGVDVRVGALSDATGKGTHTTTNAQLFHFPGGGKLIDSPGIREFGLWHMEADQIEAGFVEFRPFFGQCRFRNCGHHAEPGCALLAAVEQGVISERRFASYRALLLACESS